MKKWILLLSCLSITTLVAVLWVGTAFADVEELTLEELVTRADTIVRGSVVGLQSHWDEDHTLIYTSVTISVSGHLRPGKQRDHITVEVPGGVVEDLGMTASHAPTFEADQDVILFLQGREIVGLSQGKFTIVDDIVVESGVPVNQFIGQVHAILKGRGVPVNQFIGQVHATRKGRGIPIKPGRPKGLTQAVRRFHEALLDPDGGGFGVGAQSDGARPDASEHPESAITLPSWDTIMTEDFEGEFPGTEWTVYWNADSSADGWGYTWDNDPYTYHNGNGSGWCAGGQYKSNPDMSAPGPYPNDERGWLVYGPFDLSDATDAELLFHHWTHTEMDDDYLFVGASINGTNFYGDLLSGNWASSCGGWCSVNFDLTNVYMLGNLCGESQVWITFKFHSDSIITNEGSYLDDITLHMQTGGAMPHIDSISPDHGPAHADELGASGCAADSTRVTINGSGFGATQGSSNVRFWRKGSTYYNACVES